MNIRDSSYHAQISVTGIGQPKCYEGSVMAIFGEILRDLKTMTPRTLAAGHKEIAIVIRDQPIGVGKETLSLAKVNEIEAMLTDIDEID